MKARCDNQNKDRYKYYGGRGITYDLAWKDFDIFWADMEESWFPGATLDRQDNDGNYTKDNCQWATKQEQNRNSRQVKLTPDKKLLAEQLLREGHQVAAIARRLEVTWMCIGNLRDGRSWGG